MNAEWQRGDSVEVVLFDKACLLASTFRVDESAALQDTDRKRWGIDFDFCKSVYWRREGECIEKAGTEIAHAHWTKNNAYPPTEFPSASTNRNISGLVGLKTMSLSHTHTHTHTHTHNTTHTHTHTHTHNTTHTHRPPSSLSTNQENHRSKFSCEENKRQGTL